MRHQYSEEEHGIAAAHVNGNQQQTEKPSLEQAQVNDAIFRLERGREHWRKYVLWNTWGNAGYISCLLAVATACMLGKWGGTIASISFLLVFVGSGIFAFWRAFVNHEMCRMYGYRREDDVDASAPK